MTEEQVDRTMSIAWDVPITTTAGNVVHADVFRPAGSGRYPVIMNHGVYGKGLAIDRFRSRMVAHLAAHPLLENAGGADLADTTDQDATMDIAPDDYRVWEAVDPSVWVTAGYACVRVDSRGSGTSEGYLDPISPSEIDDFVDCIEWAGTQDWSNGRVGFAGKSYYAMTQWLVAARRPEHLAAICVWHGLSEWYRDACRHGGIAYRFWETFWYPTLVLPVQNGQGDAVNPHSHRPITGDAVLSPEQLAANRTDIGSDIRDHPTADTYYRDRTPDLRRVDVPVFASADWSDHDLHLRGTIRGFQEAASANKWLEIHSSGQFDDATSVKLQMRFFDYTLKDGVGDWSKQPPVQLDVREVDGSTTRHDVDSWPVPGTTWTPWYIDLSSGALTEQAPEQATSVTYDATGDGVVLLGPASPSATTVIGPLSLELHLSSSTTDADLFVTLDAIDPNGNLVELRDHRAGLTPLSVGWQRVSQRATTPERNTPGVPFHTHAAPQPLELGQIVPVQVELVPTSLHLPAGSRLRLTIRGNGAGHDDPVDRPPNIFANRVTMYDGPEHPSHVLVPTAALQTAHERGT